MVLYLIGGPAITLPILLKGEKQIFQIKIVNTSSLMPALLLRIYTTKSSTTI